MDMLSSLKNVVGSEYATDSETALLSYTLTQSPNLFFFPLKKPDFVVYPQTTDQVPIL